MIFCDDPKYVGIKKKRSRASQVSYNHVSVRFRPKARDKISLFSQLGNEMKKEVDDIILNILECKRQT